MNKFEVEVKQDKFENARLLSVTHNGNHWTSIRIYSDDEALQIIHALQQSFAPDATGGDGIACPICGEKSYCVHRDN